MNILRDFESAHKKTLMKNKGQFAGLSAAEQKNVLGLVRCIPLFAEMEDSTLQCLQHAELIEADAGDRVLEQGDQAHFFWVLLDGGLRAESIETDGTRRLLAKHIGCETFGEVPLLAGSPSKIECVISQPSRLLRLNEDSFWILMTTCPTVRKGILSNMAIRMEVMQTRLMQQEKLASLGTMAAGLMHELNNPGTAARRATAQLRENLVRLQEMSLRSCRMELRQDELNCMADLQEYILQPKKQTAMGSLEQSDAEDALAQWLEEASIEDAWELAPPLVSIGLSAKMLNCTRSNFRPEALSAALHWVEALVSSIQQLHTIEESITRVTDLVGAVKRYSYAEKIGRQTVDVHESLQSALVILGHKIRQKEIQVAKEFSADLPPLQIETGGLNQVWTNLLDNAIDAAPQQGRIALHTWLEEEKICVSICDNGAGILPECQAHMFEPFNTSKPIGVGTGLGLSIAYKIITGQFGGDIQFRSRPGETEFIVRVPQKQADTAGPSKDVSAD